MSKYQSAADCQSYGDIAVKPPPITFCINKPLCLNKFFLCKKARLYTIQTDYSNVFLCSIWMTSITISFFDFSFLFRHKVEYIFNKRYRLNNRNKWRSTQTLPNIMLFCSKNGISQRYFLIIYPMYIYLYSTWNFDIFT